MKHLCTRCGIQTNESGDVHCRRIFINEIKKFLSAGDLESAKDLYLSAPFNEDWKEHFLHSIGGDLEKITALEKARKSAERRHREYLRAKNIEYLGVSHISAMRKHRTPRCYNCMRGLDNEIDIECNKCLWIICDYCGACGCGYAKPNIDS